MGNKIMEALKDLVESQGFQLVDARTMDDGISEMCPIYMGIGAARRCLQLEQYKAADEILDSVQAQLEEVRGSE